MADEVVEVWDTAPATAPEAAWWYRLPGGIKHGPYPTEERARHIAGLQLRLRERFASR